MYLSEMEDELFYGDIDFEYDTLEEKEEDFRIIIQSPYIYVEELEVDIYQGLYETYNKEEQEYQADFDFYIFFDSTTKENIYEEQGSSLEVCIYNYLRSTGKENVTFEDYEIELKKIKRGN